MADEIVAREPDPDSEVAAAPDNQQRPDRRSYLIAGALLLLYCIHCSVSIVHKTWTTDELRHLRYGEQIVNGNSDRFDDSKMPVSALNAGIPRLLESVVSAIAGKENARTLNGMRAKRTVTIFFAALLGLLVFQWSWEFYGRRAAWLSLLLYCFAPNVIAHGRLITTDLPLAVSMTAVVYTFWKYCETRQWKWTIAFAMALGWCFLAKYTAVFLAPILLLLVGILYVGRRLYQQPWREQLQTLRKPLAQGLVTLVVVLLTINIGFLFNGTMHPFGSYKLRSRFFQKIQNWPGMRHIPVPVPVPYLQGLDHVKARDAADEHSGWIYLLGEVRERKPGSRGFPHYFIVAWLFKVPLVTQSIFLISLFLLFRKPDWHSLCRRELFLIVPFVFLAIWFSLFMNTHKGIRFILPLFPLMHVLCGRIALNWDSWGIRRQALLAGWMFLLIASVLSWFPHYLSYFNELVPDRKQTFRILADSNVNWGQDRWYLKKYLEQHPEAKFNPLNPTTGTIVMGTNVLTGAAGTRDRVAWLRRNYSPTGRIAYSYLIYEVSEATLNRAGEFGKRRAPESPPCRQKN